MNPKKLDTFWVHSMTDSLAQNLAGDHQTLDF